MKILSFTVLATLFCTFSQAQSTRLEIFLRDSLDIQMQRGLAQWDIPGASVCVVKGDNVLVSKGYGVCDFDKRLPVDENTLFMIGSNTKAFTGTALALLEYEQTCTLRDPVQKWLPDFRMKDPWVAQHLTLTDILCHRIGMETFQGDFTYWTSKLSIDQVIEKFGQFTPKYEFRTQWGYTNAGFVIAGKVIQAISGQTWAEFLRTRIFQPLGMNRTLAFSIEAARADNLAKPHTKVSGKLSAIPFAVIDNLAPAGSISSTVHDMSHWLLTQINNGQYQGKEVIPQTVVQRIRQPESIVGRSKRPGSHYELYGLGWVLQDYNGRELVWHYGGVNGFVTSVTLIPEEKIGIVVLTNTDANGFYQSMNRVLVDAALDLPYVDHHADLLKEYGQFEAQNLKMEKSWRDSVALHLPPTLPLVAYAGHYENNVYGSIDVKEDGQVLKMHFQHHDMTALLESLGGNRFLCTYSDPIMGIRVLPFVATTDKVTSLTLTVADFVEFTTYEFLKM